MEQVSGAEQRSALFAAPQGLISFNQPKASHPPHLRERLKDVAKVLVLEVSNPDDVLALARKMKFKVLADSTSAESAERAFWLELSGWGLWLQSTANLTFPKRLPKVS